MTKPEDPKMILKIESKTIHLIDICPPVLDISKVPIKITDATMRK